MLPYLQTLKQYYYTHTTRSRVFLSVLALLIFLGISRMVLPYAIIYSSVSWLKDQGVTANIEDITIDIFNGSVILKNATGEDDDDHTFVIGDIELFWDWSPLSEKTVQIIKVKLDNIKFDVEQYKDLMIVSGIKILPSTDNKEDVTELDDSTPWGTALRTIEFSNIALCYQQHGIEYSQSSNDTRRLDYCLHLEEMTWQGDLSYKSDNASTKNTETPQLYYSSDGDFRLSNFIITDNLLEKTFVDIEQFDLNDVIINSLNDISLASIVLTNISSLQRDDKKHIDSLRIKKLTISNINFKNLNHLSVDAINVQDPGLFIQKDKTGQWEYLLWIPDTGSEKDDNQKITETNTASAEITAPTTTQTEQKKTNTKKPGFTAELGSVTIHNSDFCYDDESNNLYTCFTQELLSWSGHSVYKSATALNIQGSLQLEKTKIANQTSKKDILDLQTLVIKDLNLKSLDDISIALIQLDKLQSLQRSNKGKTNVASINQLAINNLNLTDLQQLSIKQITLDTPKVLLKKDKNGNWEYDSLIPKSGDSKTDHKSSKTSDKKSGSKSFVTKLGNIKVLHADLCYQDDTKKLHYCVIQESTSWTGNISIGPAKNSLKAKGKLLASNTRVHNNIINRDLLRLQTFSINKANIKSAKDISVGKIKLTKLLALERAEKSNSYTLWLDSISIKDMALTDSDTLKIDTLTISEPGLQVSKNKDAKFEHDKWLAAKTDKQENPAKEEPADKNKKTFNIVLNKFKVNTRQKITFTDNSLTPAMKIGLKRIDLTVNDINSTKPKQKTSFELDAQSTKHATLELKGYALPFAEKPSFDAKGDLLGVDMRAFSPAAEKAIGHFIKSGQVDAELTLLAKEGILDSNIALTLNHFNLEAASKEDAKELDATFGMPVNQSLSLLRDKDDSIHLDLPITGDIESPEFDPTDAIIKATTKATTVALITFYTPYGLIYAGGNILFDLATAMDFPPLLFEPAKSQLSPANKEQLDSLSTMLIEKPQLHLTFCGTANLKDRLALYPVKPVENEKKENEDKAAKLPALPTLTKEQRLKLEAIADDRQKNTKEYLIENAKINHSRLIICAPAYSGEDDAISGVEIEI